MTLHKDMVALLEDLVRNLDARPAIKMLLNADPNAVELSSRMRALLRRAQDLRQLEDPKVSAYRVLTTAERPLPTSHAVFEALINAKVAVAQVGDGDRVAGLDAATFIVGEWFEEHPDGQLRKPAVAPPGGPFSNELFDTRGHVDPADVGRRA